MPTTIGRKNAGGSWFNISHNTVSGVGQNPDGRKIPGSCAPRRWEDRDIKRLRDAAPETDAVKLGGSWFHGYRKGQGPRNHGSKSQKRRDASAEIAKIPFPLSNHIARCFKPERIEASA
jgi:hypothetical protein